MDPQTSGPSQNPPHSPPQVKPVNAMAIVGFILSLLAAPIGLIFSIIGLKKVSQLQGAGRGLAIAGLVISIIGTLFWVLIILVTLLFPPEVSVSAVDRFDADTSPEAVEVISYEFRSDVDLADLFDNFSQLNQTFSYHPASPETCRVHVDRSPVHRDSVDPADWLSWSGVLTMGAGLGRTHVLAQNCGQWQLAS